MEVCRGLPQPSATPDSIPSHLRPGSFPGRISAGGSSRYSTGWIGKTPGRAGQGQGRAAYWLRMCARITEEHHRERRQSEGKGWVHGAYQSVGTEQYVHDARQRREEKKSCMMHLVASLFLLALNSSF